MPFPIGNRYTVRMRDTSGFAAAQTADARKPDNRTAMALMTVTIISLHAPAAEGGPAAARRLRGRED
jgi:hypothetical protein